MKSQVLGKSIFEVEVLNITPQGVWLLVGEREYCLTYKDFPWFRSATVSAICNVRLTSPSHLHWPDVDVDLELESLEKTANYPLVYQ